MGTIYWGLFAITLVQYLFLATFTLFVFVRRVLFERLVYNSPIPH